jgi:hypothetical protein
MPEATSQGQAQQQRKRSPVIAGIGAALVATAIAVTMLMSAPSPVAVQDQAASTQCQIVPRKLLVSTTIGSGTVRLRAGSYLSPPIKLSAQPQAVVFPLPRPEVNPVEEVISIEGNANDVVITSDVTNLRRVFDAVAAQRAAVALRLRLSGIEFLDPPFDYDKALAQLPPDARATVFVLVSPFFFRDRARQADFALRNRLATMFGFREWADAGGLMSYGASVSSMLRLAAGYVDRVARGAKLADLPIEQPTKFELVINLKTAKTLGIVLPQGFLATADEVIE